MIIYNNVENFLLVSWQHPVYIVFENWSYDVITVGEVVEWNFRGVGESELV